jgi:hypothetical protein
MTFHVRLVSLPDRPNDLVEALAADVGVTHQLITCRRSEVQAKMVLTET